MKNGIFTYITHKLYSWPLYKHGYPAAVFCHSFKADVHPANSQVLRNLVPLVRWRKQGKGW